MDHCDQMSRDISDIRVAVARVEEKLNNALGDYKIVDSIESRLDVVERRAEQARAWGAGAIAAVVAIASAATWILANMQSGALSAWK